MAGPTLLLATSNPGKRLELQAFVPPGIAILTLKDVDIVPPPEDGASFVEIACTKATFAANATGMIAIADDSGLEVDALGGAPGIWSARYAGEPTDDARNRSLLLTNLAEVPEKDRGARFRCAVAVATPDGVVTVGEGFCAGSIGCRDVGTNGFGYDALFRLSDGRTMAELTTDQKNRISHRARAYEQIAPVIARLFTVESRREQS